MTRATVRTAFPWAGTAAALVGAHALLGLPERSILQTALLNAGHAPLYMAFAALVLQATRKCGVRRPYVWAGLISLATGGLSELAQIGGARTAEWQDLGRNSLGGLAGLLLVCSLRGIAPRSRALAAGLAGILLLISFAELASVCAAYVDRDRAFPLICDFGTRWTARFVKSIDARFEVVRPPAGWAETRTERVARVDFLPADYPGLCIREAHPDWRGYGLLVVDLYSELPDTITLVLRVDDERHHGEFHDRFNRTVLIVPGPNRLRVPLEAIRQAPKTRELDMRRIRTIVLFAVRPAQTFTIYVGNLRLER